MRKNQSSRLLSLILLAIMPSCGKDSRSSDKGDAGAFHGTEGLDANPLDSLATVPVETFETVLSEDREEDSDATPQGLPTLDPITRTPTIGTSRPEVQTPAPPPNTQTPPPPPPAAFYPASCAAIKTAQPNSANGVYKIYLDAEAETRTPLDAYCDMSEDGGGWTLLLNYVHMAASNPPLWVRSVSLPLLGSDTLGADESGATAFWGHAGNALASQFKFKELRFYCRSSENSNVVHFKSSDPGCIAATTQGVGSCTGLGASFNALTGHTGTIPAAIDIGQVDRGDLALTDDAFGDEKFGADTMWSIAGDGSAWECDFGSNDEDRDTIHRVYFR